MLAPLLATFSWQELRHQPWRNAAAALAVMLGVALAFAVHLINASALAEFSSAVRATTGQPDLQLSAVQGGFDEQLFARVAGHPQVLLASPVLEVASLAPTAAGPRLPLRVIGVDALLVGALAPSLMPTPTAGADRLALFAPNLLYLNAAASRQWPQATLQLQTGMRLRQARVAGTVAAAGPALAVMDIGAAQELFDRQGQLTRIDLKLRSGVDRAAFIASLDLPAGIGVQQPDDSAQRVSNLSRAYRVNLTVMALVALFTGAFLVFSVLALSVARRSQQLALLGVLGLSARQRRNLVLAESLLLGLAGSLAGIALGTALATGALRWLGGDLGGGYFAGVAPALQWSTPAALIYTALGLLAAAVGGWLPARGARQMPLAQALKGLGSAAQNRRSHWLSLVLIGAGALLALLPPVGGVPLAAYLSVGLLLLGGITGLPALVALTYDRLAPAVAGSLLPMLAVERARRVRESAAVAIGGVVAALSLSVALTVMVASFRESVTRWLDVVLPADLYLRTAQSTAAAETAYFTAAFVQAAAQLPGVQRLTAQRSRSLLLDPTLPPLALLARRLDDPAQTLPLVGPLSPVPSGQIAVYVSEAVVDLYGARPGTEFAALANAFAPPGLDQASPPARFFVAGTWRDYARQSGAIVIDQADFERLTGDRRANELHLWLAPGADPAQVQQSIRALEQVDPGAASLIEFASARELRALSLRIFDRSFAVTYWLQAVAIVIGLFGVASSFSAQVLARRKEFGLLTHLGLTRRQILSVVAGEGAAWTLIGSIAGLALGLAVALVLVHVVNPQSFHWTMDLELPWLRLLALCAAVVAAGTLTAWLAGRAAAGADAVLAVKEDW